MGIPLLQSPTDFHSPPARVREPKPVQTRHAERGQAVGTVVHRLLQYWDFNLDTAAQWTLINRQALALGAEEECGAQEAIAEEARDLLSTFVRSPMYERLRRATVIGREVPFLMPWNEGQQIMEGVIDLLYRLEGRLWIADYKTDMIPLDQVPARAETYREQARLYRTAVEQSLGIRIAGFEFIFLRHGIAVRS
jgi:ATP-dependent helicase/nuclease subunit A